MRPKFAIVREDHRTEATLIECSSARRVLLVASAGDTALSLGLQFPGLQTSAFDFNPVQLELVRRKVSALGDGSTLDRLSQDGEFESLFRVLRHFLLEFVVSGDEISAYFDRSAPPRSLAQIFARRYWSTAFDVTFADPFLEAMFGSAATQHADPGSYGGYFRKVFEGGMLSADGPDNPFLQHVLLGHYRSGCEPPFYRASRSDRLEIGLIEGTLTDVPDLERYDLISLSNCLDWADDETTREWGRALKASTRPGCLLLLRQLNNTRPIHQFFEPQFRFDPELGARLLAEDRSMFYNRIHVGRRE